VEVLVIVTVAVGTEVGEIVVEIGVVSLPA
jgi:hypothetical protein